MQHKAQVFFGWRVVGAAFVLAVFGWGTGFYGPPVFLKVLGETRGWPVALISGAVTLHFLIGALSGANMARLHQRFGAANMTKACGLAAAAGLVGWGHAFEPWHMFAAAVLTGAGWGGMSAAALNAVVSPWFVRRRPAALGMAYNGGSVGGIVFSPLWVAAIAALGFASASVVVAGVMVIALWAIASRYFARSPEQMGLEPDGDAPGSTASSVTSPRAKPLPGASLWRDRQFLTLSAGMACGLFAQIGLVAHLYSLLAPALGTQMAGFAMALITAMAIAGRTLLGWAMPAGADRRLIACVGYVAQLAGSVAFALADGQNVVLLMTGVILFGLGFGNATSLPPLIAQVEFVKADVTRAVGLMVGLAQASYAFAPAAFGLIRSFAPTFGGSAPGAVPWLFIAAAGAQGLAILAFLGGRHLRGAPVSRAA